MEANKQNKLPEGVGKKIVEALKQQSVSINEVPDEGFSPEVELNQVQEDSWASTSVQETPVEEAKPFDFDEVIDRSSFEQQNSFEEVSATYPNEIPSVPNEVIPTQPVAAPQEPVSFVETPVQEAAPAVKADLTKPDFEVSGNVEVLRRLISQLPAGVTRQTGAQIIKQTMEAMGISMGTVLSEAQMAQESLGSSAKDCLNTIQEYKNNILILERKVQSYKKQADQLADLINLFILTDKQR